MVRLILVKLSGGWACEVFHLILVLDVLFFLCCFPRLLSLCACVCMFVRECKYPLLSYRPASMSRELELCGRVTNLLQGGFFVPVLFALSALFVLSSCLRVFCAFPVCTFLGVILYRLCR